MPGRRNYPMRKAPPKPTGPACAFCDSAYWAYNGWEWYPSDRVTRRRHACATEAAKEARRAELEDFAARRRVQEATWRRERRRSVVVKALAAVVAAVILGYVVLTPDDEPRRGPSTPAGVPNDPQFQSPARAGGEPQQPTMSSPTAKCADGTLSYSAHRQGTCSWHGGVAIWYE